MTRDWILAGVARTGGLVYHHPSARLLAIVSHDDQLGTRISVSHRGGRLSDRAPTDAELALARPLADDGAGLVELDPAWLGREGPHHPHVRQLVDPFVERLARAWEQGDTHV